MIKPLLLLTTLLLSACQTLETNQDQRSTTSSPLIYADAARTSRSNFVSQGRHYAIATQGDYASRAAQQVLNQGGNLIDAFVAASLVISVERPHSTGIGGGGFLLYKKPELAEAIVLDFRERAPQQASKEMYLDANGQYQSQLSKDGALAVAVPGLIKGLWQVHQQYGQRPWSELVAPAIQLAETGFKVYPDLHKALKQRQTVLAHYPDSKRIFLDADNQALKEGDLLVQTDLAQTLREIASTGAESFYQGRLAEQMANYIQAHQGIATVDDFKRYQAIPRQAVRSPYQNYTIVSMPPPSSGGIHVIQFLKMMEAQALAPAQMNSAQAIHYQAAALQMAFADRAQYLGDPDFVSVPSEQLIAPTYLAKRLSEIPRDRARSDQQVAYGIIDHNQYESNETTHLSLMDDQGNAISSTQTINGYMGSGAVVTGTGILLNNEMDDFSAQPGQPNMFGAIGSEANAIAGFKTPLSSMSPTLVLNAQQQPILAIGSPGGTRIISCTALSILNHLQFKLSLSEAISNIRIHQQWKPNTLFIEPPGLAAATMQQLTSMGYQLEQTPSPCRVMATRRDLSTNQLEAISDPRDIGVAVTGP